MRHLALSRRIFLFLFLFWRRLGGRAEGKVRDGVSLPADFQVGRHHLMSKSSPNHQIRFHFPFFLFRRRLILRKRPSRPDRWAISSSALVHLQRAVTSSWWSSVITQPRPPRGGGGGRDVSPPSSRSIFEIWAGGRVLIAQLTSPSITPDATVISSGSD